MKTLSLVLSILLILIFLPVLDSFCSNIKPSELFETANQKYETGDYDSAIKLYSQLVGNGNNVNSAVYFNLGNSYFRSGELGESIYAYESALLLDPRNKAIIKNLSFARSKILDQEFEKKEENPFTSFITSPYNLMTINELATFFTIFIWILFLSLTLYLWISNAVFKDLLKWVVWGSAFGLVMISFYFFPKMNSINNYSESIVVVPELNVHTGPGDNYPIHFKIHEGTRVKHQRDRNNWSQVSLPNGISGWLPGDSIKKIHPWK